MVGKKFIYTNLLIGNDSINISGDIADFPLSIDVSGSKIQEDYIISRRITRRYDIRRDSLVHMFMGLSQEEQQEQGAAIWGEISDIDNITKNLRIEYIKSRSDTYISVIDLGYLKDDLPKDTIQKIYDKYTPEIKSSKYAKLVEVYLRENISKIGDKYQDFEGFNQKEEMVKFSDIRGDFTLIDFTSAHCGPCIQAAEELLQINNIYSDSLTIVSFSGDPKKEVWLKSLQRDKIVWNSIWDGKGRYSETPIKYGVHGFPTFVLIDPVGLIIDKWSGYGEGSLKSKLKEHLGR